VILMGTEHWRPLRELLANMAEQGTIDRVDLDLLTITDSPEEAMAVLEATSVVRFGLKPAAARQSHARRWLFERPLGG